MPVEGSFFSVGVDVSERSMVYCHTVIFMKNIPVFMASGGTATLILSEIPHRAVAYVRLLTVRQREALITECAAFCRECGAETVLFSHGTEVLPGLRHCHDMLRLRVKKALLPPPEIPFHLAPMTEENDAVYQRAYNRCFADVTGAATYDRAQIRRIYEQSQLAFLALDSSGVLQGMGELHGNELAAVGLLPEYRGRGRSRDLVLTLLKECPGPEIELTAASDNEPALSLYDSLGFTVCGTISAWYMA